MKHIKSAAILLSAVIISVSGCGTIDEEAENKRLRLEQPTTVLDDATTDSETSESNESTDTSDTEEETIKKENVQTDKKILEKAVKGKSSDPDSADPAASEKTFLKETTDKSSVTGIQNTDDNEPLIISVQPDGFDFCFDVRCRKLDQAKAYSNDEAERLSSDMTKILTDALKKYGSWKRSSVWEYQENFDYDPSTYSTADLNPGKFNNIWIVDVHNPEGALLYDSRTLKLITLSEFFGESWQSIAEENHIEKLEYEPVQCSIDFDEWSFSAEINKGGKLIKITSLYKNINPEYTDLE